MQSHLDRKAIIYRSYIRMPDTAQQYAIKSANEAFDQYTGRKNACKYMSLLIRYSHSDSAG